MPVHICISPLERKYAKPGYHCMNWNTQNMKTKLRHQICSKKYTYKEAPIHTAWSIWRCIHFLCYQQDWRKSTCCHNFCCCFAFLNITWPIYWCSAFFYPTTSWISARAHVQIKIFYVCICIQDILYFSLLNRPWPICWCSAFLYPTSSSRIGARAHVPLEAACRVGQYPPYTPEQGTSVLGV